MTDNIEHFFTSSLDTIEKDAGAVAGSAREKLSEAAQIGMQTIGNIGTAAKADAATVVDTAKKGATQVLGGTEDFLQATAFSAVQRPVNGVVQLADHLGADWQAPDLISAPRDNNLATTLGNMAGTMIDVALLSAATGGGLSALGLAGSDCVIPALASRALTSGLMGMEMAAMQPVPDGTNYWSAKEKSLGQNVSSFLIMSGVSGPLQKALGNGAIGKLVAGTVSGAASGIANVGLTDLIDHKKPGVDQLQTVATWAELGLVMGGVQVATPYVGAAVSRVFKGSSSSGETPDTVGSEGNSTRGVGTNESSRAADDTAEGTGAQGPGKKNMLGRVLSMAIRRALMPRPGGGEKPDPQHVALNDAQKDKRTDGSNTNLPHLELVNDSAKSGTLS